MLSSAILFLLPALAVAAPVPDNTNEPLIPENLKTSCKGTPYTVLQPRDSPQACPNPYFVTLSVYRDPPSTSALCAALVTWYGLTTTQGSFAVTPEVKLYQPPPPDVSDTYEFRIAQANGKYPGQFLSHDDCVAGFTGDEALEAQMEGLCTVDGVTLVRVWWWERVVRGRATVTFTVEKAVARPRET